MRAQWEFDREVGVEDWCGYLTRGKRTLPRRERRTPRESERPEMLRDMSSNSTSFSDRPLTVPSLLVLA